MMRIDTAACAVFRRSACVAPYSSLAWLADGLRLCSYANKAILPAVGNFNVDCLPQQVRWLADLIRRPDAQAALALVPDYIPKDAAAWLAFCVRQGRAGAGSKFHFVKK